MERYILSKSNLVIGLTEQSRNELLLYGRDRGVMVLPNGVDLSLFSTAEGVDAKEFDIVFAGRIEMMKGSRTIPSVCRALVRSKSDIRIAVIGYGTDQRCVFEALAPLAANVFLVGKVPFAQMVEYYRRSRVYVSTSYYEGLPGTCLEAMAMGLPAVVWDRPFYRGLVVNGKTGFTLEPGDVDQMVSAVMRLLGSAEEAHAMGQRARELVLESYDWRRLAPQLLEALSSVSKKRKVKRAMA
jgi:glycosyltransferase involved in cell wall biosynthesis